MKHPAVEALLEKANPGKQSRATARATHTCAQCKGDASTFRDELSRKEYTLTLWCQQCQDKFFGV